MNLHEKSIAAKKYYTINCPTKKDEYICVNGKSIRFVDKLYEPNRFEVMFFCYWQVDSWQARTIKIMLHKMGK